MMETLTRVRSMVFSDNYRARERGFSFSSPRDDVGRLEIRLLSSPRKVSVGVSNPIYPQKKRTHRIFVSSLTSPSQTQKHLEDEETQIQDASKTVHVKFQLQKECAFGEQFHIVGDDPIFGSWDPLSAIAMDWSDGHTWTVKMDIPIGKSIQYKFILKGKTGNILWQPGPDRILQTWETNNTISVSADWDNSELQMIIEEEPSSITNDEMLIVLESSSPQSGELTVGENVIGNNGSAVNLKSSTGKKDEENPVFHEGDPILVPGLTAFTRVDAVEISPSEVHKSYAASTSLGVDEAILVPGLTAFTRVDAVEISPSEVHESYAASTSLGVDEAAESNLKKEHGNDSSHPKNSTAMMFGDGEELRVNEQAKEQDLPNSKPVETVLENDMQWGRRTLQKLLTSFNFFQHRTD
ncbi:uncharacterized protein LOC130783326 [Actinidia eriantha]|uniref:uncharacterized protein LOC130783326 n=1 Tax=Actinidia eriantha TaxID=165200 RepID=UPI0025890EDA|nr:uncharacterized protein LOC130783326 [Actinidia eriantha]